MKALTLHQPWASLVALGAKSIETRSWSTNYRGPLAIHAGKADPPALFDLGDWHGCSRGIGQPFRMACGGAPPIPLPLGAVVATCTLADVVPMVEAGTQRPQDGPHLTIAGDKLTVFPTPSAGVTVDDQRPYGDFAPGRFAWLLDDVKPTTERCPACWRTIVETGGFCAPDYYIPKCPTCRDSGLIRPIPAKGRQGIWEWDPLSDAVRAVE